jgi:hypothetical protein
MVDARVTAPQSSNLLTRDHDLITAIDAGGDRMPMDDGKLSFLCMLFHCLRMAARMDKSRNGFFHIPGL